VNGERYNMRSFNFWKIALSLALASFFVFATMYLPQPLLPLFVEVFGISVSASSFAMSATIIGLIIGLLILGVVSDRRGRTSFIKLSLLGSIIPLFIIPFLDSFLWLVILRFLQGFALAGLPAAALAYLGEEIDKKSVGVATALYISSNALGGMAGRVVTGYVTDNLSWEIAFFGWGILGIIIWLLVHFLLPKSQFFEPSNLTVKKDLEGFLFHLKNPQIMLIIFIGIILQLSFTGVWTYIPFYLQGEPFNMPLESISYTFFAYGLGVIGSPIAGWLAGRFGLDFIRTFGIITLSVGIFITLVPNVPLIVIGLCIICLGFFTAHSLTATSVTQVADHHKGSASSLYLVAYYIGVTLGSSAVGPLWNQAGWLGLILLLGMLPIIYLLFVTVITRIVKNRKKRQEKRKLS